MSAFDPTQPIPACVPGSGRDAQSEHLHRAHHPRDSWLARVGNSRPLGSIQRSFPGLRAEQCDDDPKLPPDDHQPAGRRTGVVQAVRAARPRSTLRCRPGRPWRARCSRDRLDPHAPINVSVVEISAPGGAPVAGGQQGTIALNPDPTNPDLENPDLENPDLENPDLENSEVHNPDLENATDSQSGSRESRSREPGSRESGPREHDGRQPVDSQPGPREPGPRESRSRKPGSRESRPRERRSPEWLAQRHDVDRHEQGQHGQLVYREARAQPAAARRLQESAHRAQGVSDASGTRVLAAEAVADRAPRQHTESEVRHGSRDQRTPISRTRTSRTSRLRSHPERRCASRCASSTRSRPMRSRSAPPRASRPSRSRRPSTRPRPTPASRSRRWRPCITTDAPVPGGTTGGAYAGTLASLLPGTWTVAGGTLPPGLTVDPATGAITGTPTTPGTYTFTARFTVHDGHHRLSDCHDHGRRRRRRRQRRHRLERTDHAGVDRHALRLHTQCVECRSGDCVQRARDRYAARGHDVRERDNERRIVHARQRDA